MSLTTLFVRGLSNAVSEDDLEDYFSYYGRIRRITMPRNKPIAFVEFDRRDDARYAARGMDGALVCGCRLAVEFAKEGPQSTRHSRSRSPRRSPRRRSPPIDRRRTRRRSPSRSSRSPSPLPAKRSTVRHRARSRSRSFSRSLSRD